MALDNEPESLVELANRILRQEPDERVVRDLGLPTYKAVRTWLARRSSSP